MTALNNLKGTISKHYEVLHMEQVEPQLYFSVIAIYSPFRATEYSCNSTEMQVEAVVTTGNRITYSNGVHALEDASFIDRDGVAPLRELYTNDGYRMWQHRTVDGKVTWLVTVPQNELINFLKHK